MTDALGLHVSPSRRVPDVYYCADYGRLDARASGGEWFEAGLPDGTWMLPVIERRGPGETLLGTSPYGYSGIHVGADLDAAIARQCWADAVALLRDRRLISLFLRFDPLDRRSTELAATFEGLDVVRTSTTYAVTTDEPETVWSRLEGRARTEVRKAQKAGMTASVVGADEAAVGATSAFRGLYDATMRRVDASDRYFFDDEYFRSLVRMEGTDVYVAQVELDDDIVAAAIIFKHGQRAHYHLSGSDRDAARRGANSLMLWTVIEWCAEQEVRTFHLGGGVSEGDGLARFKRSFGDQELGFYTGRAVINQDEYAAQTARRASDLGTTVEALTASGYFPAFMAGE